MRRESFASGTYLALAVVAALAIAAAFPAAAQPAGARKDLIAGGESPDLFMVYTGDVIGYLEPCG